MGSDRSKRSRLRRLLSGFACAALTVALTIVGSGGADARAAAGVQSAWSELGPGGSVIARAITTQSKCPSVKLSPSGKSMTMTTRAAPQGSSFPDRVCELNLPSSATSASVQGRPLPLPDSHPRRIVIIGDTGCRITTRGAQDCNNPVAWPFAAIAKRAAREHPDLIVDLGDMLYREAACPTGNQGCAGSPFGYNASANRADFFTPAAPLLSAAPWVLVRGNHESCSRNGLAWFRYWEPRQFNGKCAGDLTAPYRVPFPGLQLLVQDSSVASDTTANPSQVAQYRKQFATIAKWATRPSALLTHKPLWGFVQGSSGLVPVTADLQAASSNKLAKAIGLVLSGHIHGFEALGFGGAIASQLVIGDSATALDPAVTTNLVGQTVGGRKVKQATTIDRFGYAILDYSTARHAWDTLVLKDPSGKPIAKCMISAGQAACRKA